MARTPSTGCKDPLFRTVLKFEVAKQVILNRGPSVIILAIPVHPNIERHLLQAAFQLLPTIRSVMVYLQVASSVRTRLSIRNVQARLVVAYTTHDLSVTTFLMFI